MTTSLRLAAALCLAVGISGLSAADPHPLLSQVQKVYLLPMSGGFDQYVANQLTKKGLLEVVTDPKLADSVFTEAIGAGFEARLNDLLPPPPPPPTEKPPVEKGKKEERSIDTVTSEAPRTSSFGRGRGNLFLVELKTRSVVWSTYRLPKSRTPSDLDRTSAQITEALEKDLKKK